MDVYWVCDMHVEDLLQFMSVKLASYVRAKSATLAIVIRSRRTMMLIPNAARSG